MLDLHTMNGLIKELKLKVDYTKAGLGCQKVQRKIFNAIYDSKKSTEKENNYEQLVEKQRLKYIKRMIGTELSLMSFNQVM